ncbi:MAG TPA: magnesium-translocating P-type ATPase [Candidatus Saccharimonadales bacterium]
MAPKLKQFLTLSEDEVFGQAESQENGISAQVASSRQAKYGLNVLHSRKINAWIILWRQISGNALIIILAVATFVSYLMGQHISAYYIFAMILVSIVLGFWNEYAAERTVQELLKKVSLSAVVIRAGEKMEVPVSHVTLGDVVLLAPGSIIQADLRFVETGDLEVGEAALTGESKTVFKTSEALAKIPDNISDYANIGFMGTVVTSGWGKGVVLAIGQDTEFGKIAKDVSFVKPETDFQRGLRQFGDLIVKVIIALAAGIFGINALLGHPLIDSLLFALAIAVGLTPELLPIIVPISLSHGASKLAKKHVISKQLIAIENLGNMDILCTDKTGTLTEGTIQVTGALDSQGKNRPELLVLAISCNSAVHHHKVLGNAIDVALWTHAHESGITLPKGYEKITEEPFDYARQAMFCVANFDGELLLIAKGSPEAILAHCSRVEHAKEARQLFASLGKQGLRVVAVATKRVYSKAKYSWDDMDDLTFKGYITLMDVPKKSAKKSLRKLEDLDVSIKIVTGDSELVTEHICQEVGLPVTGIVMGHDLAKLKDAELHETIRKANVFARVTPDQKLQIIQTLQKDGHTVGFLGDGINDIPSLHNADVGISVNTAVDVAKEAAPIVLLRQGLDTIADGIVEGRRTFGNTLKYILMGTSSNFGNMFSAAGASFFLPFLPMLPSQILLNNGLYDISQISIPSDNVDEESLRKPRHWNIKFIKYYMLFFGPISSIYDFLTFGMMLYIFHAHGSMFQTGWFVESLATQVLVVFVIRTNRMPFYKSRASKWLTVTCLGVVGFAVLLPYMPFANSLGFVPLPPLYFLFLAGLASTYLLLVSSLKSLFLKKYSL